MGAPLANVLKFAANGQYELRQAFGVEGSYEKQESGWSSMVKSLHYSRKVTSWDVACTPRIPFLYLGEAVATSTE